FERVGGGKPRVYAIHVQAGEASRASESSHRYHYSARPLPGGADADRSSRPASPQRPSLRRRRGDPSPGTPAMTFKYKLSRRLALLRDAATLGALAVVASCELPSSADSSGLAVVGVVVVPASTTLQPKQIYQFMVYGRTKAGDSVPVAVKWSS